MDTAYKEPGGFCCRRWTPPPHHTSHSGLSTGAPGTKAWKGQHLTHWHLGAVDQMPVAAVLGLRTAAAVAVAADVALPAEQQAAVLRPALGRRQQLHQDC